MPAQPAPRRGRSRSQSASPVSRTEAWLGDVIVHAEDIRRPLGLDPTPPVEAVTAIAHRYAERDFTTPALTMATACRAAYCDDLAGAGVPLLRERCTPAL